MHIFRILLRLHKTRARLGNLTSQSSLNGPTTKWNSHTGMYSILCLDYNKHYICETQRDLEKRIYEHKRYIKTNDDRNNLFFQMIVLKRRLSFPQVILIKPMHCKKSQRLLESAVMSKTKYIKQRLGSYHISPYLANIILNDNKRKIEIG